MKNQYLNRIYASLLLLFILTIGYSQTPMYNNIFNYTGTLGSNAQPFNSTTSKVQYLYQAADFGYNGGPAIITKLYVLPQGATLQPGSMSQFDLRILTTNAVGFDSTVYLAQNQMTTLHSGAYTFSSNAVVDQWLEIPLNQPFYWDGVSNLIVYFAHAGITPKFNVYTRPSLPNNRLYGGYTNVTGTRDANVVVLGIDLFNPAQNNASVEALVSPVNYCSGMQNVSVRIANHGSNVLNSVNVHWEVNGVPQAPIAYTTPIDTFGSVSGNTATVNLGNIAITGPVTIKAYTSQPNGVVDPVTNDDTIQVTTRPALSGVYTIDSTVAPSASNYINFTALANDLNAVGVCGPVTINVVNNTGPYNERFILRNVSGTSAINKIRINGNGNILQFTNTAADRSIVLLENVEYLTIDNLIINTLASDYGWAVHLLNSCKNDSITNCTINSSSTSSTSSVAGGIIISGSITTISSSAPGSESIYIGHNRVLAGTVAGGPYFGIGIAGGSNHIVEHNELVNGVNAGIYIANASNSIIRNNEIHRSGKTVASAFKFIETNGTGLDNTQIIGNKLHSSTAPSTTSGTGTTVVSGLHLTGDASAATPMIIANNVMYNFNQNGTSTGILINGALNNKIYHNTIDFSSVGVTSTNTKGVHFEGTNTGTDFVNNTISLTGTVTGNIFGYYFSGLNPSTLIGGLNTNNIHLGNSNTTNKFYARNNTRNFATIYDFNNAYPAFNQQSLQKDPLFVNASTQDYRPQYALVARGGTNLTSLVATDVLGATRLVNPAMGAFEGLNPVNDNAGLDTLTVPNGNFCGGNQNVRVVLANNGANALNNVTINWEVNGVAQTPFNYTTSIPSIITSNDYKDTVTIGNFNFIAGTTYQVKVWTSNPNGVADVVNFDDTIRTTLQPVGFAINVVADTICTGKYVQFELNNPITTLPTLRWLTSNDGINYTVKTSSNGKILDSLLNVTSNVWLTAEFASGNITCHADTIAIKVVDPQILTSTNGNRCGVGSVVLNATAAPSDSIIWFETANAIEAIDTGAVFNTPVISANTTYYVSAVSKTSSAATATSLTPNTTYVSPAGIRFTAYNDFVLKSVTVYPNNFTMGTFDLELRNGSNVVIATKQVAITQMVSSYVINLDFYIPPGTGYYLMARNYSGGLVLRSNSGGAQYPYTIPEVVSITSSYTTSNSSANYYFFYHFTVDAICAGPRVPVQANLQVAPSVTATVSQDTICKGTSTNVSVTSSNPDYTFTWMPGNIAGATATVTPLVTTDYIVKGEDLTTGPFQNCANFDTIRVVVDSIKTPILTVTQDTLCGGDTTTISANYLSQIGVGNNSSVSSGTPNPFTYAYGGYKFEYIIRASELSAAGFVGGDAIKNVSIEFTIAPAATFNDFALSIGHTTDNAASNTFNTSTTQVYFNAGYSPVVGINTMPFSSNFIWDGVSNIVLQTCWSNNGVGNGALAPTIRYGSTSFVSSAFYRLDNATSAAICGATTYSIVTGGTNSSRPWFLFEIETPNNISYAWSPITSTTNSITDVPLNHSSTDVDKVYSLQITNHDNGCVSNVASTSVNVKPQPTAAIISEKTTLCSNSTTGVYLDASSSNGGNDYLWLADSSNAPTYLVTIPGSYVLQVQNTSGCKDWDTVAITTVNPVEPVITVTNVPGVSTLDAGAGYTSYLWSTNQLSQVITVTGSGQYFVTVTDTNGCSASDTVDVVIQPIGIESWNNLNLSLFPNPNKGTFTLSIGNYQDQDLRIDMYDLSGRIVYNQLVKEIQQEMQFTFDVSTLSDGMYMLKLSSKNSSKTLRFTIVK